MTARKRAQVGVVGVALDTPITEPVQTMRDRSVGSVLVTENDELVGIITNRDIDLDTLTVRDVMTVNPQSVNADAKIQRVLRTMNDAHTCRIPIVDDVQAVEIIAFDDLILHLVGECTHVSAQLDSLVEVIHAESPSN